MNRNDLEYFYNDGFGWICKLCEGEIKQTLNAPENQFSRLMREGEAESKQPQFSSHALARWTDAAQRTLVCPRCGISETIDKF